MGFLSRFEGKMEDTVEGAASHLGSSSLSPVQIAKKAEKQMRREKIVGAGVQHAPTLYTVLISPEEDRKLANYYPTIAGEVETYLMAKAAELGYMMDGQPLVRFIADTQLKKGKFDVVAEMVTANIVSQLREEEMSRMGLSHYGPRGGAYVPSQSNSPMDAQVDNGTYAAGGENLIDVTDDSNSSVELDAGGTPIMVGPSGLPRAEGIPAADVTPKRPSVANAGVAMSTRPSVSGAHSDDAADASAQTESAGGALDSEGNAIDVYLYDEQNDVAYVLTGKPQRIGRESSSDIVVHDINVSRAHAEIHREPSGAWILTDLGSLNGVFINGKQIKSAPLRDADIIRVGTTNLEFQLLS